MLREIKSNDKKNPSKIRLTKKEKEATIRVAKDLDIGEDIKKKTYKEFNNRTVAQEIERGQKSFNTYVPPKSSDPDEEWRAQTVRPIVRNKLISIAAHVTAEIVYPSYFAQNKSDEEDRAAAEVMRLLVEREINETNYDYEMKFLHSVMQMLSEPIAIMYCQLTETYRDIKDKYENGEYTIKRVMDEVMSGLVIELIDTQDFFWANMYEYNIQKQRFVAWRRRIEYEEAKEKYSNSKNWKYVKPGVIRMYDKSDNTFYDIEDKELADRNLIEEFTYWNRYTDEKLCFCNGIIVTDPDNPNPRIDKRYPFAAAGYEPLRNGKFFLYKSAANKLGPDEVLINAMYNLVFDGAVLAMLPPVAVYGDEEVNTNIIVPAGVTSFDKDTKIQAINTGADLNAGLKVSQEIERSMSETTQDSQRSGVASGGEKTAHEAEILERNAQKALGIFVKQVYYFVKQMGNLIASDIQQYRTMTDVVDLLSPDQSLSYHKYIIPNTKTEGSVKDVEIKFDNNIYPTVEDGSTPDTETVMKKSFELLKKEGGPEGKKKIYLVDPVMFKNLKMKAYCQPDAFEYKSKRLEKVLNLEAYDRMIANPLLDQNTVTREFLVESYRPGEGDRFIAKQPQQPQQPGKGVNQNLIGQMTGGNTLKPSPGEMGA